MTLLEKIRQLGVNALAVDDEEKIRSRTGDFAALRERLQAMSANATNVAIGWEELRAHGVVQDGIDENQAAALSAVKALIRIVDTLPIEAPLDMVQNQEPTIAKHFRNSEKLLTSAWRTHLPTMLPENDDDLLDALDRGGVNVEAIRSDLENARMTLFALQHRIFPEPGDAQRLQQALSTLNSSKARIGEVVDPAIAALVVRAQDGGVGYSEFTPSVVAALNEIGILERFRVVLK